MFPSELMRYISTFLDYNARVSFNVAVKSQDDIIVRKINSDAHNIAVRIQMIDELQTQDDLSREEKLRFVSKIVNGFYNPKDVSLLKFVDEHLGSELRNLIENWETVLREDKWFADEFWGMSRNVIRKGKWVKQMIETTKFEKKIQPRLFVAI